MHLAIGDREHSARVAQLSPDRSGACEEGLGERLLCDVAYRHCTGALLCCYFIHRQAEQLEILHSAHTVYLCVLCGSENKRRLFPFTALTDWFL